MIKRLVTAFFLITFALSSQKVMASSDDSDGEEQGSPGAPGMISFGGSNGLPLELLPLILGSMGDSEESSSGIPVDLLPMLMLSSQSSGPESFLMKIKLQSMMSQMASMFSDMKNQKEVKTSYGYFHSITKFDAERKSLNFDFHLHLGDKNLFNYEFSFIAGRLKADSKLQIAQDTVLEIEETTVHGQFGNIGEPCFCGDCNEKIPGYWDVVDGKNQTGVPFNIPSDFSVTDRKAFILSMFEVFGPEMLASLTADLSKYDEDAASSSEETKSPLATVLDSLTIQQLFWMTKVKAQVTAAMTPVMAKLVETSSTTEEEVEEMAV